MFPQNSLTPQEGEAIRKLETELPHFRHLLCSILDLDTISTPNEFVCKKGAVTIGQLPKGNWTWDRSADVKQLYSFDGVFHLSFRQTKTKRLRRSQHVDLPDIHLWLFTMTHIGSNVKTSSIWCSHGIEKEPKQELNEEFLLQLNFLAPFVSKELSIELGWVSPHYTQKIEDDTKSLITDWETSPFAMLFPEQTGEN